MSEPRFTKGPWCWHGSNRQLHLATVDRGKTYVMSFCRMGMQRAQPAFQMSRRMPGNYGMAPALELAKFEVGNRDVLGYSEAKVDDSVYRYDIRDIDHPDAHLIAASPDLYSALERLVKEHAMSYEIRRDALDFAHKALARARGDEA